MPPWAPGPYHWLPHRQSATMELGKWPREKVPGRGVVHLQQFGLKTQQVGELLTPYALLRFMKYIYIIWSVDPNQSPEYEAQYYSEIPGRNHISAAINLSYFQLMKKENSSCRFGRQYFFHHSFVQKLSTAKTRRVCTSFAPEFFQNFH